MCLTANLKDMPNPAADPSGSKGNPNTIDPFGKMLKYFEMIEADFPPESWAGLHSKCVDFVDRFFDTCSHDLHLLV